REPADDGADHELAGPTDPRRCKLSHRAWRRALPEVGMSRVTIVWLGLGMIGLAAVGCGGGSRSSDGDRGASKDADGVSDARSGDGGAADAPPVRTDAATAQTYALTVTA